MKVLVTGSAGRLGKSIVELLRKKRIEVLGVDLINSKTTTLIADIRDKREISKAVKKVDYVIHTAAIHGRHMDINVPRIKFIETNIIGTLNLLEASTNYGVKSFIYTSTTSIYGKSMENDNAAVWVDEDLTPIRRDIYDITKLAAENTFRDFFEKKN